MTPESIKMSELIMDADRRCEDKGHSMDWRRYSHNIASATCRICDCHVWINVFANQTSTGSALTTKCKGR